MKGNFLARARLLKADLGAQRQNLQQLLVKLRGRRPFDVAGQKGARALKLLLRIREAKTPGPGKAPPGSAKPPVSAQPSSKPMHLPLPNAVKPVVTS